MGERGEREAVGLHGEECEVDHESKKCFLQGMCSLNVGHALWFGTRQTDTGDGDTLMKWAAVLQ